MNDKNRNLSGDNNSEGTAEQFASLLFNRRRTLGTVIKYGARRDQIAKVILGLIVRIVWCNLPFTYLGGATPTRKVKRRASVARWARDQLVRLGPTFVKGGQLASARGDIFPPEVIEELCLLQDNVPSFAYSQVEKTFLDEFGKLPQDLFAEFDETPRAAASLGQVHRAVTFAGEQVVVKVQRPGLADQLLMDLFIIREQLEKLQESRFGKSREWLAIFDEYSRILLQEIDYINEGMNANRCRRNFADDPKVLIPRVYWRYTSPRIITFEALYGIKIDNFAGLDAFGIDRKELAALGTTSFLKMLLTHRFFHADPHPGNLAVAPNGALIYYDYGMFGELPSQISSRFSQLLAGLVTQDADRIMTGMTAIGLLDASNDLTPVRRAVVALMKSMKTDGMFDESLGNVADDLFAVARDQTIRIPANFAFVLRALGTLESVGRRLDPSFDVNDAVGPYVLPLVTEVAQEVNPLELPFAQLEDIGQKIIALPDRLDRSLTRLEQGSPLEESSRADSSKVYSKIDRGQKGTVCAVVSMGMTISATLMFLEGNVPLGAATSVVAFLMLHISIWLFRQQSNM